jgi:hypothetical protein
MALTLNRSKLCMDSVGSPNTFSHDKQTILELVQGKIEPLLDFFCRP